jgi:hypothetical protein
MSRLALTLPYASLTIHSLASQRPSLSEKNLTGIKHCQGGT